MLITSFFVGALLKRFAPKFITIPIVVIQLAFYTILVFSSTSLPMIMFYIISEITGAGLGIIITMNTVVSQAIVPEDSVGVASSMITLGRTLGQTIMTGVFGFIFNLTINIEQNKYPKISSKLLNSVISSKSANSVHIPNYLSNDLNNLLLSAFHNIFIIVLILFIVIILINLSDKRTKTLINKN